MRPPPPDAAQMLGGYQPAALAREPRMAELLQGAARSRAPAVAGVKRGCDEAAHGPGSFAQMQQHFLPEQPVLPGLLPVRGSAGVPAPVFQHAAPNTQRRHMDSVEYQPPQQQQQQRAWPANSPSLRRTNVTPALQRTANADALLRALDNMAGTLRCPVALQIPSITFDEEQGASSADGCSQHSSSAPRHQACQWQILKTC